MIEFLASPAPAWLTAAVVWASLAGMAVIAVAKALTVALLSLLRDKLPLDRATIFNQAALLQVVLLSIASATVFRHEGLEDRPTWAQLWWLETWALVSVSGTVYVGQVIGERVWPMVRDRGRDERSVEHEERAVEREGHAAEREVRSVEREVAAQEREGRAAERDARG